MFLVVSNPGISWHPKQPNRVSLDWTLAQKDADDPVVAAYMARWGLRFYGPAMGLEDGKSSFEANKAYFEKLAGVKSPDKFFELTTEYAKSAQETFVAEATKIGELYKTFAQEAFKPITSGFFLPK